MDHARPDQERPTTAAHDPRSLPRAVSLLAIAAALSVAGPTAVQAGLHPGIDVPATPAMGSAPPALTAALGASLADPVRLLSLVPLPGPPDERARAAAALQVLFGPARLEGVWAAGSRGPAHHDRVHLRLSGANLYGLRLAQVDATVAPVRLDPGALARGELRLTSDASIVMVARVLEADLDRVSAAGRMTLGRSGLTITGRPEGILGASTRLSGRIAPNRRDQLVLEAHAVSYGRLPIPRFLFGPRIDRLNPLFDLDRFLGSTRKAFDVRFGPVTHAPGSITVTLEGNLRTAPSLPASMRATRPSP